MTVGVSANEIVASAAENRQSNHHRWSKLTEMEANKMCCFPWLAAACMACPTLRFGSKSRCHLARFQAARAVRILAEQGCDSCDEPSL